MPSWSELFDALAKIGVCVVFLAILIGAWLGLDDILDERKTKKKDQ